MFCSPFFPLCLSSYLAIVFFSALAYSFTDEATALTVTVSRTGGFAEFTLSVAYSALAGEAKSPQDYGQVLSVSFTNTDTVRTFELSVVNDDWSEGAEPFTMTLGAPAFAAEYGNGALASGSSVAVATIPANDPMQGKEWDLLLP
jgi:hypothetical protein